MISPSALQASSLNADPAWDEAFVRVESYLRAHGLESRVALNEIAGHIIHEARERILAGSPAHPVTEAMRVTHEHINAWFARSKADLDWTNDRNQAHGRLALVMADLPGRWPSSFLSSEPVPAPVSAAISSSEILPCPEMRFSNMAPEPLEFGLPETGDPRLLARKFWVPARALVAWTLIVGFFGVAWAATH